MKPERDSRADNLKGLMIFLVVFCHSMEKICPGWAGEAPTRWLYCLVYGFHMPVLIFLPRDLPGSLSLDLPEILHPSIPSCPSRDFLSMSF